MRRASVAPGGIASSAHSWVALRGHSVASRFAPGASYVSPIDRKLRHGRGCGARRLALGRRPMAWAARLLSAGHGELVASLVPVLVAARRG